MTINVKFVGALRHLSGRNELTLTYKKPISLKKLVCEIAREIPKLKQSLFDTQLDELRVTGLILVNGKEISVLNGLETHLNDGDDVVFVPVVHGG